MKKVLCFAIVSIAFSTLFVSCNKQSATSTVATDSTTVVVDSTSVDSTLTDTVSVDSVK